MHFTLASCAVGRPRLPVSSYLTSKGHQPNADLCTHLSGTFPQIQVQPVYFNDPAVKKAIHAPVDVQWTECSNGSVFVGSGDTSLPSSFEVLPRILAHGVPTVVVTGLADFAVLSEGWVFVIRHLTTTHTICLTYRTRIGIQK